MSMVRDHSEKSIEVFAKTLKVGKRCKVAHFGERVVTKFGYERKNDSTWFYWYWKKEPRKDGFMDCGYSGLRVD